MPAGGLGYIALFIFIYLINNYMVGIISIYGMGTKKIGSMVIAFVFLG
jgi:hypothetical protein